MRITRVLRGAATSNLFTVPNTGRWFNPPHKWTCSDLVVFMWLFTGPPMAMFCWLYTLWYQAGFSHYQDKNYYPALPYTKEFIHKYKRLERWRWY
jgi:hypothetical protein